MYERVNVREGGREKLSEWECDRKNCARNEGTMKD